MHGMWIIVMRFFSLCLITLLISSCAKAPHPRPLPPSPPKAVKSSQSRSLPPFNNVAVEGRINVDLHTGYARPQVILHGNSNDLKQVSTNVANGKLLIKIAKGYPRYGLVRAEIRGR